MSMDQVLEGSKHNLTGAQRLPWQPMHTPQRQVEWKPTITTCSHTYPRGKVSREQTRRRRKAYDAMKRKQASNGRPAKQHVLEFPEDDQTDVKLTSLWREFNFAWMVIWPQFITELGDVLLVFSGPTSGTLDTNTWWVRCGATRYSWNATIIHLQSVNSSEHQLMWRKLFVVFSVPTGRFIPIHARNSRNPKDDTAFTSYIS